ncbi:hypothetical protein TNIN_106621 [Trichonephila inaurata madagascariensis]|uniref:Uncharacterized protein n=1 Tax=Trichonephila inaurata madagascariensis TaxID=2747483 RepID=A0A8X6XDC9_9ARAC|nr:hypothetical protein TNIN_106621 [Trichonephila inaurata madagascariensis]
MLKKCSVATSLLKELSSPTLNEEHSVSKEAGRSSSTEANMLDKTGRSSSTEANMLDKCSLATSLLKELSLPTLNEEHSVSKEAGRASSTEANGLEDLEMMPSRKIKYRHCVSHIKQLEEKLRQLISTFELLEGRVS